MLRRAARRCICPRRTGGFGFLLFSIRTISVVGFFSLFLFLKLLFFQALGFCIVRLALENLSVDELKMPV